MFLFYKKIVQIRDLTAIDSNVYILIIILKKVYFSNKKIIDIKSKSFKIGKKTTDKLNYVTK